jgi:hypothetical protein
MSSIESNKGKVWVLEDLKNRSKGKHFDNEKEAVDAWWSIAMAEKTVDQARYTISEIDHVSYKRNEDGEIEYDEDNKPIEIAGWSVKELSLDTILVAHEGKEIIRPPKLKTGGGAKK